MVGVQRMCLYTMSECSVRLPVADTAHQASSTRPPATDSVSGKRQGRTCFGGTRVTVDLLFTHLASGGTVDSFLAEYDHVGREQVVATLKRAGCIMVA